MRKLPLRAVALVLGAGAVLSALLLLEAGGPASLATWMGAISFILVAPFILAFLVIMVAALVMTMFLYITSFRKRAVLFGLAFLDVWVYPMMRR